MQNKRVSDTLRIFKYNERHARFKKHIIKKRIRCFKNYQSVNVYLCGFIIIIIIIS